MTCCSSFRFYHTQACFGCVSWRNASPQYQRVHCRISTASWIRHQNTRHIREHLIHQAFCPDRVYTVTVRILGVVFLATLLLFRIIYLIQYITTIFEFPALSPVDLMWSKVNQLFRATGNRNVFSETWVTRLNISGEIWKWRCTNAPHPTWRSKEEWEKLPKHRCAKLVASKSERLEAVTAVKGAPTKYKT